MRAGMLVAAAFLAAACSGMGEPEQAPQIETGPYVITAVDYHWHDAHPSAPLPLDGSVQFSNQGRNLHNVTIPGTDVDRNVRPGRRFTVRLAELFDGPGRYSFYCKFHTDRGMSGVLVVVDAEGG